MSNPLEWPQHNSGPGDDRGGGDDNDDETKNDEHGEEEEDLFHIGRHHQNSMMENAFDDAWNRTESVQTSTVADRNVQHEEEENEQQFRQYVQREFHMSDNDMSTLSTRSQMVVSAKKRRRRNSVSDILNMSSAPSPIGRQSRGYNTIMGTGQRSIMFDAGSAVGADIYSTGDDEEDEEDEEEELEEDESEYDDLGTGAVGLKRPRMVQSGGYDSSENEEEEEIHQYDHFNTTNSSFIERHRQSLIEDNEHTERKLDRARKENVQLREELGQAKLKSNEYSIQFGNARKQNEILQTQLEMRSAREQQAEQTQQRLTERIDQLEEELNQKRALLTAQHHGDENAMALQTTTSDLDAMDNLKEQLNATANKLKQLEYEKERDLSGAEKLQSQLSAKEHSMLEMHRANADLNKKLAEQKCELDSTRSQLQSEQRKIAQLETQLHSKDDFLLVSRQMKEELAHLQNVEKQNKKLLREKDEYFKKLENIEILKEKILTLQEQNQKLKDIEQENNNLERHRDKFAREWSEIFEQLSISEVSSTYKRLQTENARYAKDLAELKADKAALYEKIQKIDEKNDIMQKELINVRGDLQHYKQQLVDRDADITLLKQRLERESSLLNTYSQEHAIVKGESELLERVVGLEKTVSERDKQRQTLADRLQKLQSESTESSKQWQQQEIELNRKVEQLTQERDNLAAEKQELVREYNTIEQEVRQLRDFDRSTTKVLHLKFNPEAKARSSRTEETVETLKAKNAQLEHKLSQLEEHRQQSGAEELSTIDFKKRMLRLKEAFHAKINEFRTVIYLLFGYRVDLIGESEYRLSPMYAEEEHDHLVFKYEKGNSQKGSSPTVQLLDTEFTIKLKPETMDHLKMYGSMPAFLSLLTLDLFSAQTVFNGGGGGGGVSI